MPPNRESLFDCVGDASYQILEYCCCQDLAALSLVSKVSHDHVERQLYSEFAIFAGYRCEPQYTRLIQFLRTILEQPRLAIYVRRLALLGDSQFAKLDDTLKVKYPEMRLDGLDLSVAERMIDDAAPENLASLWKAGLHANDLDAIITLLISQLHNVQHIAMQLGFVSTTTLLGQYLRVVARQSSEQPHQWSLSSLRKLKTVEHTQWFPYLHRELLGQNCRDVLSFLYLPGLVEANLSLDNPNHLPWPISPLPDISSLTTLGLYVVRECFLADILSLAKSLKSFTWGWFYDANVDGPWNRAVIDLTMFGEALQNVRQTLETLRIRGNSDEWARVCHPFVTIEGSLSFLADYPHLLHLDVPMPILASSWSPKTASIKIKDVLPAQLQSLTINEDLYPYEMDDEEMLNEWRHGCVMSAMDEVWHSRHPGLARISIIYDYVERVKGFLLEAARPYNLKVREWGRRLNMIFIELRWEH